MLRLPGSLRGEMQVHMEETYPHECCGLIIGTIGEGAKTARSIRRCRNLNTERAADRYDLDPQDMLAAQKELAGGPDDIIGIYHSHPDHPSRPSKTDTDRAWPTYSYVIGSVRKGKLESLQSWELDEGAGRFEEEPIDIE